MFLFVILFLIGGTPAFIIKKDVESDLTFIKTCNESSPISLSAMSEVLIQKKLHDESKMLKCFLHCLFMKYGWMDIDGGFLLHDIKQTLEESDLEDSILKSIIYKCTAIESNDRCERGFIFTQCFWSKMSEHQPSEDQFFYNIENRK